MIPPSTQDSLLTGYTNETSEDGLTAKESWFEFRIKVKMAEGATPPPRKHLPSQQLQQQQQKQQQP